MQMKKNLNLLLPIILLVIILVTVFIILVTFNRLNLDWFIAFNKPVRTTFALGDVYRQTGKFNWEQLIVGDQLSENTKIRNQGFSTTDLRFYPNTYVRLTTNTIVELTENKTTNINIDLQQGGLYIKAYQHNPKQRILIKHPLSTIEVDDKTWAFVKAASSKGNKIALIIYVVKGAVKILQNQENYHVTKYSKAIISKKNNKPYITSISSNEIANLSKQLKKIHKNEKLVIPTQVLFRPGSYIIESEAEGDLQKVYNILDKTRYHIFIEGHTDASGDALENYNLSEKRSQAIIQYFINQGIDEERFKYRPFGEAVPVASNKTAGGRLKNRRVEFKVIDPEEEENQSETETEVEEE